MKTLFLCALAFITFSISSLAQDGEDGTVASTGPRVLLRSVADSIYMFEGKGGNIGLFIGPEGGLMIDSQFPETTDRLMQNYNGLTASPLKFLINTHHHGDHTGGNANFKDMGVTLVSHKNVRQRLINLALSAKNKEINEALEVRMRKLREDGTENAKDSIIARNEVETQQDLDIKDVFPTLTIEDAITFHLNGEEIELIPLYPGHTNGDLMVLFKKANVIHTGDAFVKGRYPYIDSKNGGMVDGYLAGLRRIKSLIDANTKIIPGHGGVASLVDLNESIRMFESILEDITFHAFSGKTLQEVQAMKEITKPYDDKGYGEGFITTAAFVEALYAAPAAKYKQAKK